MLVVQWYPTLWDPMDCSPPGSSVHEILQARILEWVTIPFSRGSSQSRDQTRSPALQADSSLSEPPGKYRGNTNTMNLWTPVASTEAPGEGGSFSPAPSHICPICLSALSLKSCSFKPEDSAVSLAGPSSRAHGLAE